MHFDPKRRRLILALAFVELAIVGTMITAVTWRSHTASAAVASTNPGPETASRQVVHVAGVPTVSVDAAPFDVEIRVGADGQVSFEDLSEHTGVIVPGKRTIRMQQDGERVDIKAHESESIDLGISSHRLRVTVPRATNVEITDCASAAIAGLTGNVKASSGNGRITLANLASDEVDVEAGNGRVEATGVRAHSFTVHASNGRIIAQNIVLNGVEPKLEVVASNGKVEFGGTLPAGGTYSMESSNGSVYVALAEKSDATVTATSSNGAVRAGSGVSLREDGDSRIATFGAGSGALSLSAPNGSITISQTNGV